MATWLRLRASGDARRGAPGTRAAIADSPRSQLLERSDASPVLLAGALAFTASAQTPPAAGDIPPPYKSLRFDENYLYLQDPARRGDVWDPLKYIPLASDPHTYLSLGGELRERGEYFSAPLFGLRGGGADAYLLHRLLLSGDLHITDNFRAFIGGAIAFQMIASNWTLAIIFRSPG